MASCAWVIPMQLGKGVQTPPPFAIPLAEMALRAIGEISFSPQGRYRGPSPSTMGAFKLP